MIRSQIATDLLPNDIQIRLSALSTLGEQDQQTPLAPDICRSLLQCLGHNQKNVQRAAAAQLIHFALNQPEIFTALTHSLSDPDARIRWTAAFTPPTRRYDAISLATQGAHDRAGVGRGEHS